MVSFFAGTPQSAALLNTAAGGTTTALVAGLLGTTTAGLTAGLLSSTPLAALAGCQVLLSVGETPNATFYLFNNATATSAVTGVVTLLPTGGNPFARFDYYFNSGPGGPTLLEFQVQCPALNSVPTTALTNAIAPILGVVGTLPTGISATSTIGTILGTLGITSLNVYIDQVAIDYYD
jgi:hypothetical protein